MHKCTLPAFTCCIKHLGKPFLAQIRPILASFGRFMGPKRLANCGVHPPNTDKDASKSPKNGVLGHFGPFGGHFYPFYIDFQGNKKQKKSIDFRSPGAPWRNYPPPLNWLYYPPTLGVITPLNWRNYHPSKNWRNYPPFGGVVTPPPFGA